MRKWTKERSRARRERRRRERRRLNMDGILGIVTAFMDPKNRLPTWTDLLHSCFPESKIGGGH